MTWDDASHTDSEMTLEEIKKDKAVRTDTIGYLVRDDEHAVTVATDIFHKYPGVFKGVNLIPKGTVISIKELK